VRLTFFGKHGALQGPNDSNTSMLVTLDGFSLLIDCSGEPARHLARAGVAVDALDALFISHAHPDHIYALPNLIMQMMILRRRKPMTIYGNGRTLAFARKLLRLYGLPNEELPLDIQWRVRQAERPFALGPMEATLIDSIHPVRCSGILLDSGRSMLLYPGDTSPNAALLELAADGCVLVHEASGLHDMAETMHLYGHSTGRQAGEMARRIGAKHLYLCHFPPDSPNMAYSIASEASAAFGGPVTIPEIDRVYTL
jgi:ribonuclease Z